MKWTPGDRSNVEDYRGRTGGAMRMGGLGLGGLLLVLLLSWVTGVDFLSLVGNPGAGPSEPVGTGGDVATSPDEEKLVDFVDSVMGDVQGTWSELLGGRYRPTAVRLFRDAVESGCGFGQSATGPFYCPADQRVYLDLGFLEELRRRFSAPGDFAQAYVLAHEVGHHVQTLIGVEERVRQLQAGRPDQRNELSVRMELQADCFAGDVNLRPCRLMPGIATPLANRKPGDIDFVVVRENTEGEYSSVGGRMFEGTEREIVFQESVFSRKGVDRILKFAFELARTRPRRKVTSATKSNGIAITMPYWDERFKAMAAQYADIATDAYHIDILTAHFVQRPQIFDVVVGSNLFGDILSDLGPAVCGTIGIAPSANINPERRFPSLFEPVHGSAPDIAGQGIANPIGQIWSGALMLDFLGHKAAGESIVGAIERVLADPAAPRTRDIGGRAGTAEVGTAIANAL